MYSPPDAPGWRPSHRLCGIDRWHYLIVLGLCVLVTLPLELGPRKYGFGVRVWRQPTRLFWALAPVWVVFVVWDLWATATGTWSFAERYTIGVMLPGDMALEELLFFIVVPVCGLLTLETVRRMLARWGIEDGGRRGSRSDDA